MVRLVWNPSLNQKTKFSLGDLMKELREHAALYAATLLCGRKLVTSMETDKPNFANQYWVDRAVVPLDFPAMAT